ncbi:MAG: beta-1,4-glucuronosyltransferase WelK [Caulobacteraceae bacterium]
MRICLAASGGGHVRQLLDLAPAWSGHDCFFVTEDTALGRTIARDRPTAFVAHFALGQARLGAPLKMAASAVRNFFQAARIVLERRPQLVITTGAGGAFFTVLWSRLTGAKVVLIESLARFEKPSIFARLTAPLAHAMVVQSQGLAPHFPHARVFDPIQSLDSPRPQKEALLFATVGAILRFDRLVSMVAELAGRGEIPERIIIQTGVGGFAPQGIETVETLPFDQVQALLEKVDIVVCHGGSGSLVSALRRGCKVIAVPRLLERGESYDRHQEQIIRAFAERGMIEVANNVEELSCALARVRLRPAVMATSNPADLIDYLRDLIADLPRRGASRRR